MHSDARNGQLFVPVGLVLAVVVVVEQAHGAVVVVVCDVEQAAPVRQTRKRRPFLMG